MFERSLSINIRLLKLVGAWPQSYLNKLGHFAYLTFIVGLFLIPVSWFPLLYIYLNENTDLTNISQTAFMSCELALIAPKLVYFLFDHERLKSVVYYWDSNIYYTIPPTRTNEIIEKTIKHARKLTTWFTLLCACGAITWATKPFQDLSSRSLPADIWLPFDPFKNDVRYIFTFLHSTIGETSLDLKYFNYKI